MRFGTSIFPPKNNRQKMGTRKKWEKSVTLNLKKVTKSNKMEAVIRIFRITAGGSNFSYSERKTVIVIQTLYKHQD